MRESRGGEGGKKATERERDRVFPRRSGKSSAVDVENGNPVIASSTISRLIENFSNVHFD